MWFTRQVPQRRFFCFEIGRSTLVTIDATSHPILVSSSTTAMYHDLDYSGPFPSGLLTGRIRYGCIRRF
jgi:hypothetical protein